MDEQCCTYVTYIQLNQLNSLLLDMINIFCFKGVMLVYELSMCTFDENNIILSKFDAQLMQVDGGIWCEV